MAWKKDKDAAQQGSVLGLGGANPPSDRNESNPAVTGTSGRSSGSPLRDEPEEKSATGSLKQSKGATGIDMGAGGEGTDIKPSNP